MKILYVSLSQERVSTLIKNLGLVCSVYYGTQDYTLVECIQDMQAVRTQLEKLGAYTIPVSTCSSMETFFKSKATHVYETPEYLTFLTNELCFRVPNGKERTKLERLDTLAQRYTCCFSRCIEQLFEKEGYQTRIYQYRNTNIEFLCGEITGKYNVAFFKYIGRMERWTFDLVPFHFRGSYALRGTNRQNIQFVLAPMFSDKREKSHT